MVEAVFWLKGVQHQLSTRPSVSPGGLCNPLVAPGVVLVLFSGLPTCLPSGTCPGFGELDE